jgi:hypothetical protein
MNIRTEKFIFFLNKKTRYNSKKTKGGTQPQWLPPIILATQEAEIRRTKV